MNKCTKTKMVFLQSLIALSAIFCTTIYAKIPTACINLFDSNGIATQNLSKLLEVTKAPIQNPANIYNIGDSLDIKKWRTHPGLERWNLKLTDNLKNNAGNIVRICKYKLNMEGKILPKNVNYSGVLFLGAALTRLVDRAHFYNELLTEGLISKELKIWALTGERKLDKKAGETKENFLKLVPPKQKALPIPTDEFSAMKFVFRYTIPQEIEVEYIYSKKDPNHTRATTASTIYTWAEKIPKSSQKLYYLAISNQPHVSYQESVINLTLKKIGREDIEVHVIGNRSQPHHDQDNYAAILLDAISKTVSNCLEELSIDETHCVLY